MKTFDEQLKHLVTEALAEDVGDGDHSALSCIPADKRGKAILKIKQDGILAGMNVAHRIFSIAEPGIIFTAYKKDADTMKYGEIVFEWKPQYIAF